MKIKRFQTRWFWALVFLFWGTLQTLPIYAQNAGQTTAAVPRATEGNSAAPLAVGPVVYYSYRIDDDTGGASNGNGNGLAESGERVELMVTVVNQGNQTATVVQGALDTGDSDVTMFDTVCGWPDILGGTDSGGKGDNFGFDVNPNLYRDKSVRFNLSVTASNGDHPWPSSFDVPIYASPRLRVTPTLLDFGETLTQLTFDIENGGGSTGTLRWNNTPSASWITSISPNSGEGNQTVTVTVSRSGLSGGEYQGIINVEANYGSERVNVTMTVPQTEVPITFTTNPSGGQIVIDGNTYTAPQTFSWLPGSQHTIGVISPWSGTPGTRYVFSSWSDGGGQNRTIITPSSSTTYNANFATQYSLTMNAGTGGTVSPASNWYNSGQNVTITAAPFSGYVFSNWTGAGAGSYTGPNNPATVTMNGPITQTANFASVPVLSVIPDNRDVSSSAGTTTFSVANAGGGTMNWTAAVASGSPWLSITSGSSGTNSGTITASFTANTGTSPRTGTITVTAPGANGSPKNVTVTQGGNTCVLSVVPDNRDVSSSAGSTTFNVTNTCGGTMNWTAAVTNGSSWLSITSDNSGTITTSYMANTGTSPRIGTITVTAPGATGSPKNVTVTQAGSTITSVLSVTPDKRNVSASAGNTSFDVANTSGGTMNWTAAVASGSPWLSISSGSSGTNSGTITASFTANTGTSPRTGTITVTAPGATGSPQNVTVTQSPIDGCSLTWQADLTVRDAGSNTATLSFGQGANATNDIDVACGEAELPPSPPTGIFDARFELPVSSAKASLKDYRNSSQQEVDWRVKFQPGVNGPMNFSWNSSALLNGCFSLKDEITGTLVNVDMKRQSSYSLTISGITTLKIEYSPCETCRDVSVAAGWNIVSIAVLANNMSVSALFSDAASQAFAFNNGYINATSLTNGKGYWIKFNVAKTYNICGAPVTPKRIPVVAGWNIIGPFETDVSVAAIASSPANIIVSAFFGYNNGYTQATTLSVGKGYWVKASQAGELILPGSAMAKQSAETEAARMMQQNEVNANWPMLVIEDSEGNSGRIYLMPAAELNANFEMPPTPPAGIFDVRFSSGRYVESLESGQPEIQINSAHYPIRLQAQNLGDRVLVVKDALGGSVLNATLATGKDLVITKAIEKMTLASAQQLPSRYALSQNYPNPFNPATMIRFALPEKSHVKLILYNVVGEKVAELVNQELPAGYHQVEFNASRLASGVYLYEMKSGSFRDLKKMLIQK